MRKSKPREALSVNVLSTTKKNYNLSFLSLVFLEPRFKRERISLYSSKHLRTQKAAKLKATN